MNKNGFIVLVLILFGFLNTLSAQHQIKDSTEAYNYWAQHGIIEMVYAYMNDYIETVGEDKAKSEIIGRNKYKENFISEINNKELESFETISSLLKSNSWRETEKKLFQPLKKNYDNKIELDSNFFEAKKPGSNDLVTVIPGQNNKNVNWNKKQQEIIDNYNSQLTVFSKKRIQKDKFKEEKISPVDEKIKEPKKPKQVPSEQSKWMKWIIYLAVFILGILIGGWLVYTLIKKKITEKLDYVDEKERRIKSRIKEHKSNEKSSFFTKSFQDENEKIKSENSELKRKIEELKNTSHNQEQTPQSEITHEWEIKQSEKTTRKLFFSMPESDGRFIIDNGESSNDGRKYFRIEYNEGSETGDLYYISGDRDQRAINRLESYLKPACDIENIENADSATNIEFIKPGKVFLINDSWVIDSDNKAQIKLL